MGLITKTRRVNRWFGGLMFASMAVASWFYERRPSTPIGDYVVALGWGGPVRYFTEGEAWAFYCAYAFGALWLLSGIVLMAIDPEERKTRSGGD